MHGRPKMCGILGRTVKVWDEGRRGEEAIKMDNTDQSGGSRSGIGTVGEESIGTRDHRRAVAAVPEPTRQCLCCHKPPQMAEKKQLTQLPAVIVNLNSAPCAGEIGGGKCPVLHPLRGNFVKAWRYTWGRLSIYVNQFFSVAVGTPT